MPKNARKPSRKAADHPKLLFDPRTPLSRRDLVALRRPVLAAVRGQCLGGGMELAAFCHFLFAESSAVFGQPEIKLGIIPGFAGTQRLARLVGKGRAKEMIYTGEMIDAAEAYRIGLVNRVVAKDRLIKEAKALAMKMCDTSASAIRLCKEAIDNGMEMDFARAARYEADLFGLSFTTADCKEGISAFLEKRPAKF